MKIKPDEKKDDFKDLTPENRIQYKLGLLMAAGTTFIWFIKLCIINAL